MTYNMQNSILQISRHFRRVSCLRDFHLFQNCLSAKLTDHGSLGKIDEDVFVEDRLEDKINRPSKRPQFDRKMKKSVKKDLEYQQRQFIKRKIIEKRERALYGQKRPRLLTWAARSQIKYLHETDPIYWTADMLAQSFPVSWHEVIRILKKNHIPPDEQYVQDYDIGVYMNWLRLKQAKQDYIEGRPVDPEFRSIVESETLSMMKNAAGSLAFPIPGTEYLQLTKKAIAEKRRPKTKGEFSAILEDYEKDKEILKEEKKTKHIELEDPNYVALLTGLSEMKVEEDIYEEHTYKEQETRDKYQDEKLFYDEYDDNVDTDMNIYSRDEEKQTWNTEKLTDNSKKEELTQNTISPFQKQKFGRKKSILHNRKETDFQKSTAKWVKESSKELERNMRKVGK